MRDLELQDAKVSKTPGSKIGTRSAAVKAEDDGDGDNGLATCADGLGCQGESRSDSGTVMVKMSAGKIVEIKRLGRDGGDGSAGWRIYPAAMDVVDGQWYILQSDADHGGSDDDDPAMGPEEATSFRSAVARLNYMASDRPDIQYAVKEVARNMSSPK